MNIIIWGVRLIEDLDNRGSDNRGCTAFSLIHVYRILRSNLIANRRQTVRQFVTNCSYE